MNEAQQIIAEIKKGNLLPIYFLMGDEPFFIDMISNYMEENVLSEIEKAFNQMVIYGKDIAVDTLINYAREFPIGAEKRVIIVKEAQELSRTIEQLSAYVENPTPTTILVICYKYGKIDARKKLFKELKKYVLFESKKLYENQVATWIPSYLKSKGYTISPVAIQLLVDFLGTDLTRIANELNKLSIILPKNTEITPDIIEKNIGISKEFNVFELQNALGHRDEVKAIRIIKYFSENQRDNPLPPIIANLYNYFEKLLIYHGTDDKSEVNLAKVLKVNPFFVKDYRLASQHYPMKKVSQNIAFIRQIDVKSKGVNSGTITYEDLLKELVIQLIR